MKIYIYYLITNTNFDIKIQYGDWGLGIGGLGLGDWAQPQTPNPQSPIPNPHYLFNEIVILNFFHQIIIMWGLGIGDWGLGIGGWGPAPTPQPPFPNPQIPIFCIIYKF